VVVVRPKAKAKPESESLPAVPERELADAFEFALRLMGPGVVWYHTHDSRRSQPGFPDYIVLAGGTAYAFEIKRDGGELTAAQESWLRALAGAGLVAAVLVGPDGVAWAVRWLESGRRTGIIRPGVVLLAAGGARSEVLPPGTRRVVAGTPGRSTNRG